MKLDDLKTICDELRRRKYPSEFVLLPQIDPELNYAVGPTIYIMFDADPHFMECMDTLNSNGSLSDTISTIEQETLNYWNSIKYDIYNDEEDYKCISDYKEYLASLPPPLRHREQHTAINPCCVTVSPCFTKTKVEPPLQDMRNILIAAGKLDPIQSLATPWSEILAKFEAYEEGNRQHNAANDADLGYTGKYGE